LPIFLANARQKPFFILSAVAVIALTFVEFDVGHQVTVLQMLYFVWLFLEQGKPEVQM